MADKPRLIRFWLLILVLVALPLVMDWRDAIIPESLVLFGIFSACCCGSSNSCPNTCTTSPHSQYQIVTGGFSNTGISCTDCTSYNGTWTVTISSCGVCYCANVAVSPCPCFTALLANQNTGEKYATNQLALLINETGQLIQIDFLTNITTSSTSSCAVIDGAGAGRIGFKWQNSGVSVSCGTLSSYSVATFVGPLMDCNQDGSAAMLTAI